MKRFQFNLQALLEMKQRNEDQAKRALAEVNARLLQAQAVMDNIEQEWYHLQNDEIVRRQEGTTPVSMGWAVSYRLWLQEKATQQHLVIQRIDAEQEAKRQALVKARQERKAIENIRERRWQEWRDQYNRQLTKTIDDICQIQYVRKQEQR